MQTSRLRACGLIRHYHRILFVSGICAILLATGADTYGPLTSSDVCSEIEAAEKSTRQKRIKRLKLADPESTEVMLA